MADPKLPDWIDRRTAIWCAEHCEAIAARLLRTRLPEIELRKGVELCGTSIRAMLAVDLQSERTAAASQEARAYAYLQHLLSVVAPQCEPLPDLIGLCTQIDSVIVWVKEQAASRARREIEEAVRSCPSLDENGYICTKDAAIKAILAQQPGAATLELETQKKPADPAEAEPAG